MAKTYTAKTHELGWEYIEMLDSDKPDSVCYIPIEPANSEYQAYIRWLNGEEETGTIS